MNSLFWTLVATFLISLISFLGVLTFFLKEKILNKILLFLVAFSAGGLIAGAFLDLIPEAIEQAEIIGKPLPEVFLYLIAGFCFFFVLEQFIKWHHHHSASHPEIHPFSYLILFSDAMHNFIDGLILAGAFLTSFPLGVVTAVSVALHEIPQEIGDFGVLVYGGFKRAKALFFNFLSAIPAILGGLFGFFVLGKISGGIFFLLPFAAGSFIYIASSDLIPQIKEEKELKKSLLYFFTFLAGIALIWLLILKVGE
jgi:zinc and cadmium transporter